MFNRLFARLIDPIVTAQVALVTRALDDSRDRPAKSTYPRDRYDYDRAEVLADALEAWRVNPLARRIVGLTTQYVVGGGITLFCKHVRTNKFLQEMWNHRQNHMLTRSYELCDELTRSGELFVILSTDLSGMSYLRVLPAANVVEIETAINDVEQEVAIYEVADQQAANPINTPSGLLASRRWPVYNAQQDAPLDGQFSPVLLHYAINRPVGAKHGESDLAPLLRWLTRYASWLEDRARLNRYRQAFIFLVSAKFSNKADKVARQFELNQDPPSPGSILVADESEKWSVLSPNLASFEAAEDGLALKKMVSAGSATPLHFLAEPESATRTTAEAAGGPTYRHYQQRQIFFLWMLRDIFSVAIKRRSHFDRLIDPDAKIVTTGSDLESQDNSALASAASSIIAGFSKLHANALITDAEFLRVVYRFAGEVVDVEDILKQAEINPPTPPPAPAAPTTEAANGD